MSYPGTWKCFFCNQPTTKSVSNSKEEQSVKWKPRKLLIRWKHLPEYEATWEPIESSHQQFHAFHLEDKVILWEEGVDTNAILGQTGKRWGPCIPAANLFVSINKL